MMGAKKITPKDGLQFLSLTEVATRTSFSRKTIERFAREGRLKTLRISGRRVVQMKDFIAFLQASVEDGVLEV